MTITKAQLFDMVCDLKARLDALEGRRVEASDREYMRLILSGDKDGARAMLHELDRRGGMQRQSTVCSTGEESRTAADR